MEEAANERKAEAKSVIESQKEKAQQMWKKIFQVDHNCAKIQEEIANVKRSTQQFADNMMPIIEAKKEEIFNAAENQGKQSLERLGIQKSDIEQQARKIETGVEKAEALLQRSTSALITQLDKSLKTIFQKGVRRDEEQVDCDFEDLRRLIFVENETLLKKANTEGIGSLKTFSKTEAQQSNAEGNGIDEVTVGLEAQFVLTTRNAEGEQCYEARDCVTVEMKNRQGQDCATKARVQDNQDGSYKISYFAKETGRCHLSVKVNEKHVHGSPFATQVKPRQFRPVLSFGQLGSGAGMLNCPWGVAVNERNEIAVTDSCNDRIQVFNSDGAHLRSFGREGDNKGEFNRVPSGIAFDPKNENILVADRRNHRVQLFSEQGEYLNQFSEEGNLDHQLLFPRGLSVDSDSNVIVADSDNKVIKIFSHNGHFLQKYPGIVSNMTIIL